MKLIRTALLLDVGEIAVLSTALREGSADPKDWREFWREAKETGADVEKARGAARSVLRQFCAFAEEIIRPVGGG